MTNTEKKAKELGLKYFPDALNVFARTNVDAYKAEYACLEMAEWKEQQMIEKACEWLNNNTITSTNGYVVYTASSYDINKEEFIESFKKAMEE